MVSEWVVLDVESDAELPYELVVPYSAYELAAAELVQTIEARDC